MRFKDAFNKTVIKPIENLERKLLMRDAYKRLDAYLERESLIYQQLSKERMKNSLRTSEILGLKPDREECEIEYGNKSFILGLRRGELRQIGLSEFLKKHPEYSEVLVPSCTDIINTFANYRNRIKQYLRELN